MLLRDLAFKLAIAQPSCPPIEVLPTAELIRMGGFAAVAGYAIVVAMLYRMDRNRERKESLAKDDKHQGFVDKVVDAQLKSVTATEQLNGTIAKSNDLMETLVTRILNLEDEIARLREGREAKKRPPAGGSDVQ